MYITTHLILILALLTTVVRCPGGSDSSRSNSSSRSRKEPCRTRECDLQDSISAVIGALVGVGVLTCWIVSCYRRCTRGRPSQVNTDFIREYNLGNRNYERDPLETGIWSFRYYQYGKWHGPYRLPLSFDRYLGKVTGEGTDDVGSFIFDGIFSLENLRLALTQKYVEGTGDPNENLGHISTIQLTWNSKNNQFEGKWYVRTSKYSGEGEFELKVEETSASLLQAFNEC
ncbi:unnamed protein product [Rotaria sp. Silwood2]|nr:unnamed protein product [Rotaria sp. Silwood2]CAF2627792.1 unnamed protein product [Rotaria sp. Silwood2]CAF4055429.1 unnamed protein product [Rotaria sp. Silwood2]